MKTELSEIRSLRRDDRIAIQRRMWRTGRNLNEYNLTSRFAERAAISSERGVDGITIMGSNRRCAFVSIADWLLDGYCFAVLSRVRIRDAKSSISRVTFYFPPVNTLRVYHVTVWRKRRLSYVAVCRQSHVSWIKSETRARTRGFCLPWRVYAVSHCGTRYPLKSVNCCSNDRTVIRVPIPSYNYAPTRASSVRQIYVQRNQLQLTYCWLMRLKCA